jgi:protein-S-isoprenylcysteine O-methyltransferase Ste14
MGFFFMMWAWWLFKQQDLAVCHTAKTEHITAEGPYRFTRNPMYLGFVLMMLGQESSPALALRVILPANTLFNQPVDFRLSCVQMDYSKKFTFGRGIYIIPASR